MCERTQESAGDVLARLLHKNDNIDERAGTLVGIHMKNTGIVLLVSLLCSACTTHRYIPPKVEPPALWSGRSGWIWDGDSARVSEGTRRSGETFIEHDARLRRTGIIQESIQMKNAYGKDLIIPAGTKAFAANYTLMQGTRSAQAIDPIEWCVYLPRGVDGWQKGAETVCIFWESETQARYDQDFQVGGFVFHPNLYAPVGVRGVVPKIQPADVDFGFKFTRQIRVAKISKSGVRIETALSDGTSSKRIESEDLKWGPDGTLAYAFGGIAVILEPSKDFKAVEVRRRGKPPATFTELLELDYGRACGSTATEQEMSSSRVSLPRFTPEHPVVQPEYPAESRQRGEEGTIQMRMLVNESGEVVRSEIIRSSSYEALDRSILAAARNWKVAPGRVNDEPRCMWQTFSFTFSLSI